MCFRRPCLSWRHLCWWQWSSAFSSTEKAHPFLVPVYGIMVLAFIALYQIELGGIAKDVVDSLNQ